MVVLTHGHLRRTETYHNDSKESNDNQTSPRNGVDEDPLTASNKSTRRTGNQSVSINASDMSNLSANHPSTLPPDGTNANAVEASVTNRVESLETTFLVVTFGRCSMVERLVLHPSGIRKRFAQSPIRVMDNGWQSEEAAQNVTASRNCIQRLRSENVDYSFAAFDVGIAKSRNLLVAEVRTPYLMMMDDDTIFPQDVSPLYDALSLYPDAGLAGASMDRINNLFDNRFCVNEKRKVACTYLSDPKDATIGRRSLTENGKCIWTNGTTHNFFLARSEVVQRHLWPEQFKIYEHKSFFFRLWRDHIGVISCPEVFYRNVISEAADETYSPAARDYDRYRYRNISLPNSDLLNRTLGVMQFDGLRDDAQHPPPNHVHCNEVCGLKTF